jgi:hypothetical protein
MSSFGYDGLARQRRFHSRSNVSWKALAGFMQTMGSPAYDGRTHQTIFATEALTRPPA